MCMNLLTPPSTLQRHHSRERRVLRDVRTAADQSPRRRRIAHPSDSSIDNRRVGDENTPPSTFPATNPRSAGQRRRRERERREQDENAPPSGPARPPRMPRTGKSRAQQCQTLHLEKVTFVGSTSRAPKAEKSPTKMMNNGTPARLKFTGFFGSQGSDSEEGAPPSKKRKTTEGCAIAESVPQDKGEGPSSGRRSKHN
ncbi:hypothetical protein B0H14DRAFT_3719737 [Mycena olivaceomarginata]|nr:hypothetical protein B0H14DRAFT_3719737 [Mycena olivaceomarginata]